VVRVYLRHLFRILPDAASEQLGRLSSHPSFRGRCLPDLGVVRPPNVGKREWFYGEPADPSGREGGRSISRPSSGAPADR
jgi:hypothetical protein